MTDTGEHQISPQDMTALIQRGLARPLMAGYDPVPVHHDGTWWHIPAEAAPDAWYVPASPAAHQVFDDLAARLALADAAVARARDDADRLP